MNKRIFYLIIVLFFLSGKVNSQNMPVQKYQAYFNYKVLRCALQKRDKVQNESTLLNYLPDSSTFNITEIKHKISKNDSNLIKLCDELLLLNHTAFISDDTSTIRTFFTQTVFSNSIYPSLNHLSTKEKKYIIDNFNIFLKNSYIKNEGKGNNLFLIIILIVTICALIIIFILSYKYYRRVKKKYIKKEELTIILKDFIPKEEYKVFATGKEINLINDKLIGLEKPIKENSKPNNFVAKGHHRKHHFEKIIIEKESKVLIDQVSSPPSEIIEYYFSTPNDNGSFLDRNKAIYFEPDSKFFLFKIEKDKPEKAIVTIVNDIEAQQNILNNYKEHLDSVCNYENPFFKTAAKIITKKAGIANLDDGKWIIKESDKLIIKFQ